MSRRDYTFDAFMQRCDILFFKDSQDLKNNKSITHSFRHIAPELADRTTDI